MPLVLAGEADEAPRTAAHAEARKIHPRYAGGELVRVTVVPNLAEAELIKGVLLEQGIPSMLRRTAGFDVPDFLAAGPRDVLVPEGGAAVARELLGQREPQPPTARSTPWVRVLALILAVFVIALVAASILNAIL